MLWIVKLYLNEQHINQNKDIYVSYINYNFFCVSNYISFVLYLISKGTFTAIQIML
jgi:hypothetical protein